MKTHVFSGFSSCVLRLLSEIIQLCRLHWKFMVAFAILVEMKLLAVHRGICDRGFIKPVQTIACLSCLSGPFARIYLAVW